MNALDAVRSLAIIEVLLYHCRVPPFASGGFGAALAFALSGFLITSILLKEFHKTSSISLKRFFIRRALRLFPALVLFLLLFGGVAVGLQLRSWDVILDLGLALSGLLNWARAFAIGHSRDLGHLWALSIEFQFYILWAPMALFVLTVTRSAGMLFWFSLSLGLAFAFHRENLAEQGAPFRRLYNGFDTRADGLMFGCALAALYYSEFAKRFKSVFEGAAPFLLVLGLALHAIAVSTLTIRQWPSSMGGGLLVNASVLCLIAGAAFCSGPKLRTFLSAAPFAGVSTLSYGIYLWHYPAIRVFQSVTDLRELRFGYVFLASGVLAFLSYYFVERRFLGQRRRFRQLPLTENAPPAGQLASAASA